MCRQMRAMYFSSTASHPSCSVLSSNRPAASAGKKKPRPTGGAKQHRRHCVNCEERQRLLDELASVLSAAAAREQQLKNEASKAAAEAENARLAELETERAAAAKAAAAAETAAEAGPTGKRTESAGVTGVWFMSALEASRDKPRSASACGAHSARY